MKPIELAILFHDTYERLAPSFGYETRTDPRVFDHESKNGHLMVAVCGEILERFSAPKDGEVAALIDAARGALKVLLRYPAAHDVEIRALRLALEPARLSALQPAKETK